MKTMTRVASSSAKAEAEFEQALHDACVWRAWDATQDGRWSEGSAQQWAHLSEVGRKHEDVVAVEAAAFYTQYIQRARKVREVLGV